MTVCGIKHADGVCVMGECPYVKMCCPTVWDKSGEPMTNEEHLKSCNTEQLATFLAIVQYDGTDLTLKKNHVEKWVEWLKEINDEKA